MPLTLPPAARRGDEIDALLDHFVALRRGRELSFEPNRAGRDGTGRATIRKLSTGRARGAAGARSDDLDRPAARQGAVPATLRDRDHIAGRTVHGSAKRQLIFEAFGTNNNRNHAARIMLGISVRTLRNKLAQYRLRGTMQPT